MAIKLFVWSIVREALLQKSEPAIQAAAEAIAKYTPITAERAHDFLKAAVALLVALGDGAINQVASYVGFALNFGAGPDSAIEPAEIIPPDQLAPYRDVLDAIRDCDCDECTAEP